MIELKTPGELAAMARAGAVVAAVLRALRAHATEGVTLRELDELAAAMIADAGAKPSFLDYQPSLASVPYPAVVCTSVNDAIVHGVPTGYTLAAGDLLSIDFAVHLDGWCADAATSFCVDREDAASGALIDTTTEALQAGIAQCVPGNRLGDVAAAIGAVGRGAGYGIVADHGGHGIGRSMHEAPHVANEGRPGRGLVLRPGLVLALEPMFTLGGRDPYRLDADGWTMRTVDGSRAAHVEHTVAITEDGPRVLTA